MRLVTSAEMRELDRQTIQLGTPGATLMERAGAGIAAHVHERFAGPARRGVLVVCGRGNNGGDGFVVARLLAERAYSAQAVLLGRRAELAGDARRNADRWAEAGGRLVELEELDESGRRVLRAELAQAGVVVDGIFGTGLTREVAGAAAAAIAEINAVSWPERAKPARSRGARGGATPAAAPIPPEVIAIDVPSGLDSDTGEPHGTAVRATATVTLGAVKPGLVLPAARSYVGSLSLVEIGIAPEAFRSLGSRGESGDATTLARLVPRRTPGAHKGTNGHLLVVAGSRGKSGAAILAARGALRGGAGLVTVACPSEIQATVSAGAPELMTDATGPFSAEEWRERVTGKTAAVVGPGLGTSDATRELVRWLATSAGVPLVIDADGLNVLAGDLGALAHARHGIVLTPHPGEMSRLVGRGTGEIQARRIDTARELARGTGAIVVLKGSGTVVAAADGRWTINTSGGPILGSGGTGDALAGLTGALLAQGLDPYDAARLAVFLHGRAADRLALRLGDAGLLASELADELPLARRELAASAGTRSLGD